MIVMISVLFLAMADPNDPAIYCHGYLQMMCDGWLRRPVVEYYRSPPAKHAAGKIHLTASDGTPETVVETVRLDRMDLQSFGRYAETYDGGLKIKPKPLSASPPMTLEDVAMFMELFMKETE